MPEPVDATLARRLAASLTPTQRDELLAYGEDEGFMPPCRAHVARYLWNGIMPRGFADGPFFLLLKKRGRAIYRPSPLGFAAAKLLVEATK